MKREIICFSVLIAGVLASGGIHAAASQHAEGELPLETTQLSVDQLESVYADQRKGRSIEMADRALMPLQETWPKFGPTLDWGSPRPTVELLLPVPLPPIRLDPIK